MLINCPECGREISSFSKVCPHCGYPLDKPIEEMISNEFIYEGYVEIGFFGSELYRHSIAQRRAIPGKRLKVSVDGVVVNDNIFIGDILHIKSRRDCEVKIFGDGKTVDWFVPYPLGKDNGIWWSIEHNKYPPIYSILFSCKGLFGNSANISLFSAGTDVDGDGRLNPRSGIVGSRLKSREEYDKFINRLITLPYNPEHKGQIVEIEI